MTGHLPLCCLIRAAEAQYRALGAPIELRSATHRVIISPPTAAIRVYLASGRALSPREWQHDYHAAWPHQPERKLK